MRVSYGKWTKHKLMSQSDKLIGYLPDTQYFKKEILWSMLDKHKQVMLKPCFGYQGIGIVQLTALEGDAIEFHKNYKKLILNGKDETFSYLKENHFSKKRKPRYIVQQKIPLATINNNPFDIRVMVQRKKTSSEWVVTGKLAKVAANNYVITNAAKAVLSVEEAINRSTLDNEATQKIISELEHVSLLVAHHLAKSYPKKRVYGIDLAIDQEGRIWIIEANLSPATSMFKFLKDGSYETIKSYKRG
ncbi:YheC/YheD family protein [Neobacillus kokaensis]|uniref:ATP-grasp domain-containing protein n=1 Tax=Neobacillus kokaensis TaxID=2759023 RepID=A0ABQ3N6A4_9BACI|nr:YheC/YheD family protein [Neobacillus kokaensis]GHH99576.1 hypothetical protein AM1BK_31190 [Neobacillus kokaensis]